LALIRVQLEFKLALALIHKTLELE